MSVPTTSAEWAMRDYPQARCNELEALLRLVPLAPGIRVIDVQAAGGYVSDEIFRRLGGDVTCVCIEPSDDLRGRLDPRFEVHGDAVDRWAGIESASADRVVGLAALHHSGSIPDTIAEAGRALRPGGTCALCEVAPDTAVAGWLNEFVDTHNPAGHEGEFPPLEVIQRLMEEAGLLVDHAAREAVPWIFEAEEDAVRFFAGLFGLECEPAEIRRGIHAYFQPAMQSDRFIVPWHLNYLRGRKPVS